MLSKVWNFIFHQYEVFLLPRITRYWLYVEPYYDIAKSLLLHVTVAFIVVSFCLYISAFLFGVVYYYNMPTIHHTYELNFQYNRQCIQQHRNYLKNGGSAAIYEDKCYPKAFVDFDSSATAKVLRPEQPHTVYLSLQLPESDTNLEIGMFMTKMTVGKKSFSQPAILRFRLPVLRYAYMAMLWPLFLFDVMQTKQTLDIPLFEKIRFEFPSSYDIKMCQSKLDRMVNKWEEEVFCNHRRAVIEIDYPDIQIYSAQLHLTATFSGLQRFFFQWPVFSFLVGTAFFFVPVLTSVLVLLYLILCKPFWMNSSTAANGLEEAEMVEEERQDEVNDLDLQEPIGPVHCDNDEVGSSSSSTPAVEMIGSPTSSMSEVTAPPLSELPKADYEEDSENSDNEEASVLRKRK